MRVISHIVVKLDCRLGCHGMWRRRIYDEKAAVRAVYLPDLKENLAGSGATHRISIDSEESSVSQIYLARSCPSTDVSCTTKKNRRLSLKLDSIYDFAENTGDCRALSASRLNVSRGAGLEVDIAKSPKPRPEG